MIRQEKDAFTTWVLKKFNIHLGSIWSGRWEPKLWYRVLAKEEVLEKRAKPAKRVYRKRDQEHVLVK